MVPSMNSLDFYYHKILYAQRNYMNSKLRVLRFNVYTRIV